MVSRDGWKVTLRDTKKKSTFEDIECDLLPVKVVVNKFFSAEHADILVKRVEVEQLGGEIEALPEENPDAYDEGLFEMLEKVNEANVKKAVAAQKKHTIEADSEVVKVWNKYLDLCAKKKEAAKVLSALIDKLTENVRRKYDALNEEEIRDLVIYDKWLQELCTRSEAENKRVCESISSRIYILNERYAKTLPQINSDIAHFNKTVNDFLKAMGVTL